MRSPLPVVLVAMEVAVLAIQITTLSSMHWTTWDLQFNWTQSPGDGSRRPRADGQVVSQGHAGLWSRCIRVSRLGNNLNESKADKCLSNSDESPQQPYSYGKTCKRATAFLCIGEAFVTFLLVALLSVCFWWKGAPVILHYLKLPCLLVQGALSVVIPIIYISGNMAELVEHLASTYGYLLVVSMKVWYIHDWAFWLQTSIPFIWMATALLLPPFESEKEGSTFCSSFRLNRNKKTTNNDATPDGNDMPEMQALRGIKP